MISPLFVGSLNFRLDLLRSIIQQNKVMTRTRLIFVLIDVRDSLERVLRSVDLDRGSDL